MESFVFFFDADHDSLGSFYGPPCTNAVIECILKYKNNIASRILKGDLLAHFLAYKQIEISTITTEKSARHMRSKLVADNDLYTLLICDLSDSFSNPLCTINLYEFPFLVATHRIWCIALPTITEGDFIHIDKHLQDFPAYIGGSKLDTGNPIQLRSLPLIDSMFIKNKNLYLLKQEDDMSDLYEDHIRPNILSTKIYSEAAPAPLSQTKTSERGQQSVERYEGKIQPTHRQRLLKLLVEQLEINPDITDFTFSSELKEGLTEFICSEDKVRNYLLDINHPHGASKANFFINHLGIIRDDWKYLADQISSGMSNGLLYKANNTEHGISHSGIIAILGRNGKKVYIRTGWMTHGNESARLVTAYPYPDELAEELLPPDQNIVLPSLMGNDRWSEIYINANNAGINAANKCIPTPMTIKNHSPVFEGLCGFAYIIVKDTRMGMAKWLKDNGIGSKNYRSGWSISADPTPSPGGHWDHQSVEPKKAYANSFAKVLTDNGVDCYVEVYLD